LLDFDDEACRCVESLMADRVLVPRQTTYTTFGTQADAQIEDWCHPNLFREWLHQNYGPVLDNPPFQRSRSKWSVRIRPSFAALGLDWERNEQSVTSEVADLVAASPQGALKADAREPFMALAKGLEGLGVRRV
jgi:hypothetical protein